MRHSAFDTLVMARLRDLRSELRRLFVEFESELVAAEPPGFGGFGPALDITEDSEALYLHIDVPGMSAEHLDLSFHQGFLVLRGTRPALSPAPGQQYLCFERHPGEFERRIPLERPVDPRAIRASLRAGVLEVVVPFLQDRRGKPFRIAVQSLPENEPATDNLVPRLENN